MGASKHVPNSLLASTDCIARRPSAASADTANAAAVLSTAVARAAERLNISRSLLPKILGVSPTTITRLYAGNYQLVAAA